VVARSRVTDPYLELIRERVDKTKGRVKGKRLLNLLRAAGPPPA
jgi:hypothetical protein